MPNQKECNKKFADYKEFSNKVFSLYNEFKKRYGQLKSIENLMIEISLAQ